MRAPDPTASAAPIPAPIPAPAGAGGECPAFDHAIPVWRRAPPTLRSPPPPPQIPSPALGNLSRQDVVPHGPGLQGAEYLSGTYRRGGIERLSPIATGIAERKPAPRITGDHIHGEHRGNRFRTEFGEERAHARFRPAAGDALDEQRVSRRQRHAVNNRPRGFLPRNVRRGLRWVDVQRLSRPPPQFTSGHWTGIARRRPPLPAPRRAAPLPSPTPATTTQRVAIALSSSPGRSRAHPCANSRTSS